MVRSHNAARWVGMLTVAALTALPAGAQHRVDNRVRNDANNRVGSGGLNNPVRDQRRSPAVEGNNIITGNVTAGREFRGDVPYRSQYEFRGDVAGERIDRFIGRSAGAPTDFEPRQDFTVPRAYFPRSTTVKPPPGFEKHELSGSYIPTRPFRLRQEAQWQYDTELSSPYLSRPQPPELILSAPTGVTQDPTWMTASPLTGIRQWQAEEGNIFDPTRTVAEAERLRMEEARLRQLRDELRYSPQEPPADEQVDPTQALPRPMETPADPALAPTALTDQLQRTPLQTGPETLQSTRYRLLLPADQQSEQYAELQKRFQRYQDQREPTDEEAHQQFQKQLRERDARNKLKELQQGQTPGSTGDRALPTEVPQPEPLDPQLRQPQIEERPRKPDDFMILPPARPNAPTTQPQAAQRPKPAAKPLPVRVNSIAEGIRVKGLAELMKEAEDLMREGKYTSSLEKYETARQAAPNNPLIALSTAFAELGAGYYARADAHLREAIQSDPAILIGRYDLRRFLGQSRVDFLIKDLQEITRAEPGQVRPPFLLAFIAYNVAQPAEAARYLADADQRSPEADPVIQLMREYWSLPAARSSPDANK